MPRFIRSDNGPEFIAKYLMRLFAVHGIEARHIDPGSPWQNGRNERFNGTVRGECLNMETFGSRDHARMVCKLYGRQYNTERPHSSLRYLTPGEYADRYAASHGGNLRGAVKRQSAGALPPPPPRDLSLFPPPAGWGKKNGSSDQARPASRKAIRVGAPVASQQSRILRADGSKVTTSKGVRKVLAQIR